MRLEPDSFLVAKGLVWLAVEHCGGRSALSEVLLQRTKSCATPQRGIRCKSMVQRAHAGRQYLKETCPCLRGLNFTERMSWHTTLQLSIRDDST